MSMRRRRRLLGGGSLAALVTSIGGDANVPALYDARFGITAPGNFVAQWDDARGVTGFGPSLTNTGSARPTFDPVAQTITFDGVDDYLRGTGGAITALADPLAVFIVATMPATQTAANRRMYVLSAGTTEAVRGYVKASADLYEVIGQTSVASVGSVVGLAGTRVLQGRRTAALVAGEIGANAEVSTVGAQTATSSDTLTIAAGTGVAANFLGFTVMAVGVTLGLSPAQWAAIQAWAQSTHGATL